MQKQSVYSLKKRGFKVISTHISRDAADIARSMETAYPLADMPIVQLASGRWAVCVPRQSAAR